MIVIATSGTSAIVATAVVVVGFLLGSVAAAVTRKAASAEGRSRPIAESAAALATLAFSIVLITALVVALGIVNRAALDQLTSDTVGFLPRILSALIVMIMGNVLAALAETAASRALGAVTPEVRERVPLVVKWGIRVLAVVIAADQLGIDTTIVNIAVAALLFGFGLAAALLAGLGSRSVAEQIAAGRAVRRSIVAGSSIRVDGMTAEVVTVGSTATTVRVDGGTRLIPNRTLLESVVELLGDT